jgi:NitT/TauT family transport system ATP-binding protein
MEPLISVREIQKRFITRTGGAVTALDRTSLDIAEDEFVTIVGPSGCGKTTLLRLIAGIVPPSSGEIVLKGRKVLRPSREIGMVFQQPILLSWRTVLDNVLFPIEMLGWAVAKYRDEAMRLIELVGLKGFESARPRELSGGMQQRVAICRALVSDPQVLLMDEPFAALDAMTREELGVELLRIWSERRKTVVFITHSIPEAILLADRVLVMTARPGRVVRELKIDLPRPRRIEMEHSAEFGRYSAAVRSSITSSRVLAAAA